MLLVLLGHLVHYLLPKWWEACLHPLEARGDCLQVSSQSWSMCKILGTVWAAAIGDIVGDQTPVAMHLHCMDGQRLLGCEFCLTSFANPGCGLLLRDIKVSQRSITQ